MDKIRNKALVSLQAFLPEDKEIVRILNICEMTPGKNWRYWTNNQGLGIKISSKKTISTYAPKLQFISDLHFKSSPKKVASISKLVLIEDPVTSFLFWGRDDRLRLFVYNQGWERISLQNVLISTLRAMVKNEFVEDFIKIKVGWITTWPPSPKLLKKVNIIHSLL